MELLISLLNQDTATIRHKKQAIQLIYCKIIVNLAQLIWTTRKMG